jgi:hypothetical protein
MLSKGLAWPRTSMIQCWSRMARAVSSSVVRAELGEDGLAIVEVDRRGDLLVVARARRLQRIALALRSFLAALRRWSSAACGESAAHRTGRCELMSTLLLNASRMPITRSSICAF